MMKILCFGNPMVEGDRLALDVGKRLNGKVGGAEFIVCGIHDIILDVAAESGETVYILDVVKGIDSVRVIEPESLKATRTITAHDIDVSFYVRLLSAMGREMRVIGIPEGLELKRASKEVKELVSFMVKLP